MKMELSDNPKLYLLRAWAGPTMVHAVAEDFRHAGLIDVMEGVEYVYWKCSGDRPEHAVWRSREIVRTLCDGRNMGMWQGFGAARVVREV